MEKLREIKSRFMLGFDRFVWSRNELEKKIKRNLWFARSKILLLICYCYRSKYFVIFIEERRLSSIVPKLDQFESWSKRLKRKSFGLFFVFEYFIFEVGIMARGEGIYFECFPQEAEEFFSLISSSLRIWDLFHSFDANKF